MKYRKKPVVVEAYQTDKEMIIHTLEGDMKASVGDFIITGVNGEQYPCKPDIFEKTYEKINEGNLMDEWAGCKADKCPYGKEYGNCDTCSYLIRKLNKAESEDKE